MTGTIGDMGSADLGPLHNPQDPDEDGGSRPMNERNARVAAAVMQLGCEVGAIANSLVFDCDGAPLLVMASGAARVDTDLLARNLGAAAITKAGPAFVRGATGQVIGGVAPTGHPARLRTVVDQTLVRYPVLWTAAGTPDSVMPLTYQQLLALTDGVEVAVR